MTQAAQQFDDEQKPPYNIELFFEEEYDATKDAYLPHTELFEDIVGYQVGNDVLAVLTKAGETVIFPMRRISQARHFPQAV